MNANAGAFISYSLAIILSGVVTMLVLEGTLLRTGQRPITTYVRATVLRYPARAVTTGMLIIFAMGLLTAHFFWDAGCG